MVLVSSDELRAQHLVHDVSCSTSLDSIARVVVF